MVNGIRRKMQTVVEQQPKYPEEVLMYIEHIKKHFEENPAVAKEMLGRNQISLSSFLDVAAAKSMEVFQETGNPILKVDEIVHVCYRIIIENNLVDLVEKGWLEVVGLNNEGNPLYELTELGKKNLLKNLPHGK